MIFISISRRGSLFRARLSSPSPRQKSWLSTLPGPTGMTTTDPQLIDTIPKLKTLLSKLTESPLPSNPPSLYIDLEGRALSRHGSISIMQIFHLPTGQIYLVDVHTLGDAAFTTPLDDDQPEPEPEPQDPTQSTAQQEKGDPQTLKSILQHPTIQKAFFDVRSDADALYAQYGVYLRGIQDIQLMELATRTYERTHLAGLAKCIARDAGLSEDEALILRKIKKKGLMLSTPERGGSYDVFNKRPMSQEMVDYCALDVSVLPRLWRAYSKRLWGERGRMWRERIREATRERVDLCLEVGSPWGDGSGRRDKARAFGPASFLEEVEGTVDGNGVGGI
ncbi:ribonuclease H-like domain-containing protein [Aspergillus multicolor]|uniref:ribonuclease H-like domain-containing protein n=1 Tax=Aspergillus multicolor TaxID=41759 RepID=UPI003CCD9F88